jgi:DNA-binding transcriptional regulator LsrR (DeoR family)
MPTSYHKPLKTLLPLHMKIIELYLQCWKTKDIAAKLGISTRTVSHTLKDPVAKDIISTKLSESLSQSFDNYR